MVKVTKEIANLAKGYTPTYGTIPQTSPTLENYQAMLQEEAKNKSALEAQRQACLAKGGYWDAATGKCLKENPNTPQVDTKNAIDLSKQPEQPTATPQPTVGDKVAGSYSGEKEGFTTAGGKFYPTSNPDFVPTVPEQSVTVNKDGTVTLAGADGKPITLTKEEYKTYRGMGGNITNNVLAAQNLPTAADIQQQRLSQIAQQQAGQVGQFGELGVSPTGLNVGEAVTTGLINAIPRALSFAATGALTAGLIGGAAGTAVAPGAGTTIGAGGGAAIGAVGGFTTGITSSIIGNFKQQRTDTTKAQKRVLDEGKQNLNDWATLAASDPANRQLYINNFNQQLALIDQAYRQMKLDTSRDVAKFETALPDLAEFEAFYAAQGERDYLVIKMRTAVQTPQDVENLYQMQEMATRRLRGL